MIRELAMVVKDSAGTLDGWPSPSAPPSTTSPAPNGWVSSAPACCWNWPWRLRVPEALDAKLKSMVPELLEANGCMPADGQVAVELLARRFSVALPAAA